ncbi:hypothetical protein OE88DRAFT_1667242 [Heliocybe sulcata]|uniref:Uncharacterized protein n=1 Tax=Heliocybe sulcata TaxID=5364 RepID=A0A5C3MQJ4_9AGAM|nr:hypothetical protein OE88DRAFT_1667242 [Heliocybe sulcata]
MAAAVAGPSKTSPFGILLRRSKFASFDPSIAQVYTAYDGNAHRGNFGLKRPLPVKKRNRHVTVTQFDSGEQQTAWNYADKQARWIKAWQELGVEFMGQADHPQDPRTWDSRLGLARSNWVVDSEFDVQEKKPGKSDKGEPVIQNKAPILPNIQAMSEKQFDLFLKRLRRMRPKFKRYMKQKAELGMVVPDLLRQAQRDLIYHKEFIQEHIKKEVNVSSSKTLLQEPHPYAGVSYSHNTRLSTLFLTPALPGRMLRMKRDDGPQAMSRKDNIGYVTSFANMLTRVGSRHADGKTEVLALPDGSPRDPEAGRTQLRLSKVNLIRAPSVVGGQEGDGMYGTMVNTEAVAFNRPSLTRPNPHYPGSMAYSGQDPGSDDQVADMQRIYTPMFTARNPPGTHKPSVYMERTSESGKKMISGLRDMLNAARASSNK